MLKEYTLKVTCEVGGDTDEECEEKLTRTMGNDMNISTWEITHEEVLHNEEVERE